MLEDQKNWCKNCKCYNHSSWQISCPWCHSDLVLDPSTAFELAWQEELYKDIPETVLDFDTE